MNRDVRWWFQKANALAPALGAKATRTRVALLLSVATHETSCGDAWAGEHNWGATTRGALAPADVALLHASGCIPVLSPEAARLESEAHANAVLGPRPDRVVHVDSRPARADDAPRMCFHKLAAFGARFGALYAASQIVYYTWFARFDSDEQGAAYFVSFFHTAGELAALQGSDPGTLARAMYSAHYYTGFSPADETNIAAYTNAIAPLYREAMAALSSWAPGAPLPEAEPAQGVTWQWVQAALNNAGASPPLSVDGIPGPKTRAALGTWQASEGLPATGRADEATVQALRGPEANA